MSEHSQIKGSEINVNASPDNPAALQLGSADDAFSRGGNRLCFVHPGDSNRCIKVLRSDRLPAIKRSEKSFPKNLKSLDAFDDNAQEMVVYEKIQKCIGESAFELIPRCYGYLDTNLGAGLCSDMIRDDDGQIAITLKQYLWQYGKTAEILLCIEQFGQRWQELGMPSRNLLLHNIVIQCRNGVPDRLYVIDGLGWSDLFPIGYLLPSQARRKAGKKIRTLAMAIDALLYKKEHKIHYGYHGWITDNKRR